METMKPVVIFGAGQVAEVIAETMGDAVAAFVVDPEFVDDYTVFGRPLVSSQDVVKLFPPEHYLSLIGLSFKGLNTLRAKKFAQMEAIGYTPVGCVGLDVWIPNSAKIGEGTIIQSRNTIQSRVEIGENCMLWAGNHLGHHTKIGNHVWLSSGIVVSGACEIGDFSFIGSGATIIDGVKIGKRCIISAGATITRDCEDDGVYPGPYAVRSKVPSHKLKGVWAQ
jgi:sugar O-acyltransferase (sialic acid O-acetyltransferase NeuD family)